MSYYDKSSLVLIPSGTKTSKVFSQKPTNGDGDFDFTRSTAATRIAANGNIEKETSNLLTHSNGFLSWWSKPVSTITDGQAGYDGTNDASLLSKTAPTGYITRSVSVSGVQTFSVYAKKGSLNWTYIQVIGGSNPYAFFDLENGGVGDLGGANGITSAIETIGNGWYRCSLVFNESISSVRIYPADANNDVSGASGNIFIQDAQINQGLVAQPYQETTTTALYGGITDNVPRLDYTDSSCPALLLEPQRTNLIPQSEYFGAWTNDELSIDSDFYDSPEGVSNANFLIPTTASGIHKSRVDLSSVTGLYTQSVYAKQGGYKNLLVWEDSTSGGIGVNLDDLSIFRNQNNSGYNVEEVGNGWVRISVTHNFSAQLMLPSLYIYDNSATPAISYAGDGTSGIYVYGAQQEAGSYATSYIPTYGAGVTRNADICNSSENSVLFNKTEGVLFLESSALAEGTDRRISISDGTFNNYVSIGYSRFTGNIVAEMVANGVLQTSDWGATGVTQIDNNKFAFSWGGGTMKFYVNGVQRQTTSVTSPIGLDILRFSAGNSSLRFIGETKQVLVFPTALSDADLEILTGTYYESYSAMAAALNYTVYE